VGIAVAVTVALGLVRVEGSAFCPSPAQVAEALLRLEAGEPNGVDGADHARIERADGGVEIVLFGAGGERRKARRLVADAPCEELAAAAAVIIAAWERELGPRRLAPASVAVTPSPPLRARLAWDLGGAFTGALSGSSFAPGGSVAANLVARRAHVGGRLAAVGTATRDQQLAPGHASYTRAFFQLGPVARFNPSRLALDLHAELSLALTSLEGVGYATVARAFDFDPGLGGGARLGVRAGPVLPFLEVAVVGWLRRQRFDVTGVASAAELPRFDLLLSAGLAFGRVR
jgi:hypothetical protein